MKSTYVKDLAYGQVISGETFAIKDVNTGTDKNNQPYYDLVLADKTGEIKGKVWSDHIQEVEKSSLKTGRIVAISARVDQFKGALQLNVLSLKGVDEKELDNYMNTSSFKPEEMWDELMGVVKSVGKEDLKELLESVLKDVEIKKRLMYWPAAMSVHHDFRSGLLQHILEMLTVAEGLERFYPEVDFDMVKTGIVLHDIGKLEELDGSGMVASYTTEGALIGHIALGIKMLEKYWPKDISYSNKLHVQHIILSHHGTKEFGSPVLPATVESILVHYIDNVSAKARTVTQGLEEGKDEHGFTSFNRWMGTRLWSGAKEIKELDEESEVGY